MDWVDRGLCRTQPDRMFAEGAAQNQAKAVCVACTVRLDCLAYALDHREEYGVWGAMTERERRALLRSRPAVTSWAEVFRTVGPPREAAQVGERREAAPARTRRRTASAQARQDAASGRGPQAADRTPSGPVQARVRRPGTAPAGLDR
ncbi:WhiB family transcriptional regulator [Streptomyces sp. NPDC048521]|uniref:WhiB family transcriptional regulator n=1 Tax=Streptomyces sp. NPDC048521 TaxID=3365566 RepID=UPI003713080E